MGVREDAKTYLQRIVSGQVTSKANPLVFDSYCGPPPRVMLPGTVIPDPDIPAFPSWDKRLDYSYSHKGNLTACNSFVGVYGQKMRIPFAVGGFDIEQISANANYTDAYVPARSGKKPQTGDIMTWAQPHLHMGVCWEEGGTIYQVAAGQGGPVVGFDIIRKAPEQVDYASKLRGWLDLELATDSSNQNKLSPTAWLVGTWALTWDGQKYYYWFGNGGLAQYSHSAPLHKNMPPDSPHDRGRYTISDTTITVVWNATGSREIFTRTGDRTMQGVWNNTDRFTATKM
jgi:hypothetical protein